MAKCVPPFAPGGGPVGHVSYARPLDVWVWPTNQTRVDHPGRGRNPSRREEECKWGVMCLMRSADWKLNTIRYSAQKFGAGATHQRVKDVPRPPDKLTPVLAKSHGKF